MSPVVPLFFSQVRIHSPLASLRVINISLYTGYTYYHFSGLKTIVSTSQSVQASVKSAKDRLLQQAPESPNQAIEYLRSVSKSYIAIIPGAGYYVDSTFDTIDELSKTHGDEVNEIVKGAIDDLKAIGKKGGADIETASKVLDVLRRRGEQLAKLAAQAGEDVLGPILEKHPEVKEKIGGGWEQLSELAKSSGAPEAKKLVEDTTKQVEDIFKQGFSIDSIEKARKLLQEKTEEVKKITDKASKQAWDKAQEAG